MSRIRVTTSHNHNLAGIMLPMNTVYGIFPPVVRNGRACPMMYAWIKDPDMARRQRHFTVCVLRGQDKYVHTEYVDGERGFAKELKDVLMRTTMGHISGFVSRGEYRSMLPQDRKIGAYNQRARAGKEDNPEYNDILMTENSVTAGCKVGKIYYTEEGYICVRMGVKPDDYGKGKRAESKSESEFAGLDLEKDFTI